MAVSSDGRAVNKRGRETEYRGQRGGLSVAMKESQEIPGRKKHPVQNTHNTLELTLTKLVLRSVKNAAASSAPNSPATLLFSKSYANSWKSTKKTAKRAEQRECLKPQTSLVTAKSRPTG